MRRFYSVFTLSIHVSLSLPWHEGERESVSCVAAAVKCKNAN